MIGALLIGLKIFGEKIWEEKKLEDGEHDEQFDYNHFPQSSAHRHTTKTVEIKIKDADRVETFHCDWCLIAFHEKAERTDSN